MYVHNVPVSTGTTRTHVSTCARGAGIHGDVLDVHTRRRVGRTHREGGKGREGKGREGKGREGKGKGREGKGREGKGREGKGREGKGREGKGREEGGRRESSSASCFSSVKQVFFDIS